MRSVSSGLAKSCSSRCLADSDHPIRTLAMLSHVTGTSEDECRRLLIEIGARGVVMSGQREGWALIERYPLDRAYEQNP